MILPVHNEARRIEAKIANLLSLDYPMDLLQLIVIGDGCTDDTWLWPRRLWRACGHRCIASPRRQGRRPQRRTATCQGRDRRIYRCRHPARSWGIGEPRGTLPEPRGGCVSGEDYVEGGGSEGLYGRLELLMRREEARLHSIAGASGCFYGMRRALCRPFSPAWRRIFSRSSIPFALGTAPSCEPTARGAMMATTSQRAEFSRKARTFLRGLTALFGNVELLNPVRHPAFSFILWSHKLMRWLGPVSLVLCLLSAFVTRDSACLCGHAVRTACVLRTGPRGAGVAERGRAVHAGAAQRHSSCW